HRGPIRQRIRVDALLRLGGRVNGLGASQATITIHILDNPIGTVNSAGVGTKAPVDVLRSDPGFIHRGIPRSDLAAGTGVGNENAIVRARVFPGLIVVLIDDCVASSFQPLPDQIIAARQGGATNDHKDRGHYCVTPTASTIQVLPVRRIAARRYWPSGITYDSS